MYGAKTRTRNQLELILSKFAAGTARTQTQNVVLPMCCIKLSVLLLLCQA
jgi:hypothetical protein